MKLTVFLLWLAMTDGMIVGWICSSSSSSSCSVEHHFRRVFLSCCAPRFSVSKHQIGRGMEEAFREECVAATYVAIKRRWDCAVFVPDKTLQVCCHEEFLVLTSPRSQTVWQCIDTQPLERPPFVLQQFRICWTLKPVYVPPSCQKKTSQREESRLVQPV